MGSSIAALIALVWLTGTALAECAPGTVELRAPDGAESAFQVELADTPELRQAGLMFRARLDPAAGMLFVYDSPGHRQFWMKNTLIALDMIFVDAAGQVRVVHDNAAPLDETPIDGGEGVRYVLEINGGLAGQLGIVPGAVMRGQAMAEGLDWPCP